MERYKVDQAFCLKMHAHDPAIPSHTTVPTIVTAYTQYQMIYNYGYETYNSGRINCQSFAIYHSAVTQSVTNQSVPKAIFILLVQT